MSRTKPETVKMKTFFGFHFPFRLWHNPLLQQYFFKKTGSCAMDFGCGRRGSLPELAKTYSYVIGLDMCLNHPEEYSLRSAKEMCRKMGLHNVDLVLADCQNPPFREAVFDSVVFNHVLEHMMNPRRVLGYMEKILKSDGRLYVEVPWLSELISPNFNSSAVKQWAKVLITRALDDLVMRKKSLLAELFFKFDKESKTIRPRMYLPREYFAGAWYRKTIKLEDYANQFLHGELRDPHHKHFYTKKEWIKAVESAKLRIEICKGSYFVSIVTKKA